MAGAKRKRLTARPSATPFVVVLAGGGAKGFAHLAVLCQLERDHMPIARIVDPTMGTARGSGDSYKLFLQLGRRFSF